MTSVSDFDEVAVDFDRHRALPADVVLAVRSTLIESIRPRSGARLLDLGAGTGRFGHVFVAAGDDYVAVDRSIGMLRRFQARLHSDQANAKLVQADGQALPFRDASFDAVLLIHAFGSQPGWRRVLAEALRVLRATGSIVIGRTRRPADGVDARLKQCLQQLLDDAGAPHRGASAGDDAGRWLDNNTFCSGWQQVAAWQVQASPRTFIERQRSGARFHRLPAALKEQALQRLAIWAAATFDSIDGAWPEQHALELAFHQPTSG